VANPLEGAVVAVVPEGAVVAGVVAGVVVAGAAVVGVAVVGACRAVVGVADVAGVEPPPPIGGWVSGTVVAGVDGGRDVLELPPTVGVWVVGGAAVVVLVVDSPLRTTAVATAAPRTPKISTASAMPTSRLR
jgi:hypothetical protein